VLHRHRALRTARETKRRIGFLVGIALLAIGIGAATAAGMSSSSSPGERALVALNRLPQADFPAIVSRAVRPEHGTLTFRMSFFGMPIVLTASATSVGFGQVGTLSRTASDFVLRFTRALDRVTPIKLPNGLEIASQTLALDPTVPSTLRIDRRTGAVSSDNHWVVDAPNTLYNDSHTITLPDKGQRRLISFTQLASGRYRFAVRTQWHASVTLSSWSVAGTALPGGVVNIAATWTSYYVLNLTH